MNNPFAANSKRNQFYEPNEEAVAIDMDQMEEPEQQPRGFTMTTIK